MRTQLSGMTLCVGIALLLAGGASPARASAQNASTQDAPPPPADAPPPPSMDDPGIATAAPTAGKHARESNKNIAAIPALPAESAPVATIPLASASMEPQAGSLTSTDPTPPKPSLTQAATNPSGPSAADTRYSGDGITVSTRTMDNGDRIEEYRSGGQLMRVKVTPRKAPPYEIIDTNGNGRIDEHDRNAQKSVGWTLFKWH